jgi:hypothetical protein
MKNDEPEFEVEDDIDLIEQSDEAFRNQQMNDWNTRSAAAEAFQEQPAIPPSVVQAAQPNGADLWGGDEEEPSQSQNADVKLDGHDIWSEGEGENSNQRQLDVPLKDNDLWSDGDGEKPVQSAPAQRLPPNWHQTQPNQPQISSYQQKPNQYPYQPPQNGRSSSNQSSNYRQQTSYPSRQMTQNQRPPANQNNYEPPSDFSKLLPLGNRSENNNYSQNRSIEVSFQILIENSFFRGIRHATTTNGELPCRQIDNRFPTVCGTRSSRDSIHVI